MSASRRKGTDAESAVVQYLRDHWFPYAERRSLNGSKDKGDIAGVPHVCWEVKSGAQLRIQDWLKELRAEVINAGALHGVLVIKPKGVGDTRVNEWWAVMPLSEAAGLLCDTVGALPLATPLDDVNVEGVL